MIVVKCDRCGKFIEKEEQGGWFIRVNKAVKDLVGSITGSGRAEYRIMVRQSPTDSFCAMDLCDSCEKELAEWINKEEACCEDTKSNQNPSGKEVKFGNF